jgi:cob(I)alamin adenosyltransferase
MVILYTGEGKGKTTAALGLALRAAGRGRRVLVLQFVKAPGTSGEQLLPPGAIPNLTVEAAGRGFLPVEGEPAPEARAAARAALARAAEATAGGAFDVVVLDEIVYALHRGLVSPEDVLDLVARRDPQTSLVLTGHHAPPALIEAADLVTEMRSLKHPFDTGGPAVEGIDL